MLAVSSVIMTTVLIDRFILWLSMKSSLDLPILFSVKKNFLEGRRGHRHGCQSPVCSGLSSSPCNHM